MAVNKINLKSLLSGKSIRNIAYIIVIIILMFVFNAMTNNIFTSVRNLTLLMKQASVLMIVSSGIMLLLVERNFDLSGGAAVYFVSVIVAQLAVTYKLDLWVSFLLSMCAGIIMGSINGLFIGYAGIPAFIGTLAAQLVFKGIGYSWTNAATIGPIPESFAWFSEGYIPRTISVIIIATVGVASCLMCILDYRKMKQWYGKINRLFIKIAAIIGVCALAIWIFTGYYGIPMCAFFAMIMAAITSFISNKTVFGRHIFIIGGNPEAAKMAGINTKKRIFQSYLYMGVIYGVAGIIITARLGGSTATTGNLIELDAVAAACIGGTSMSGGVGRITGVAIGVLILSAVDNVMSLMNVSSYLQMVVKGVILLLAICMDVYVNKNRFKLKKKTKAGSIA
jgi:ABC-type xylose transport system permease subunit